MTYSCSDFTDDILNGLGIEVPDEDQDNPARQAEMALAEIRKLQARCKPMRYVLLEETGRYTLERYGGGTFYVITRQNDGASVCLQGDDAATFEADYDLADAKARDQEDRNAKMDMIMSEYDLIMSQH